MKPGDSRKMMPRKEARIGADDLPETILTAGLHRQRQIALLAQVVHRERGRIDMGKDIAALAQRGFEVLRLGGDGIEVKRIAGDDGEAFAQHRKIRTRGGELAQINQSEAITLARHDIKTHLRGGFGADGTGRLAG